MSATGRRRPRVGGGSACCWSCESRGETGVQAASLAIEVAVDAKHVVSELPVIGRKQVRELQANGLMNIQQVQEKSATVPRVVTVAKRVRKADRAVTDLDQERYVGMRLLVAAGLSWGIGLQLRAMECHAYRVACIRRLSTRSAALRVSADACGARTRVVDGLRGIS